VEAEPGRIADLLIYTDLEKESHDDLLAVHDRSFVISESTELVQN